MTISDTPAHQNAEATHAEQVRRGDRFEFGKNWKQFLSTLDDERIAEAERSLKSMLSVETLDGKSFLDVGSGSGLFSLAARRLGARVHSFDFDPQSVACTMELKKRFFAADSSWIIDEASVLDADYVVALGSFDVVYSWGVLHHTGAMLPAICLNRSAGSSEYGYGKVVRPPAQVSSGRG